MEVGAAAAGVIGGDLDLAIVVDALCAAEAGRPVDETDLPYYVACWFLDHAARFRQGAAWAALRLIEQIIRRGDDEMCARGALALVDYVALAPVDAERLLFELAEHPSRHVRAALLGAVMAYFGATDDSDAACRRWLRRSHAAGAMALRARKLLAVQARRRASSACASG